MVRSSQKKKRSPFGEPRRPWWRRAGSGLLATLAVIGAKLKAILVLLPKVKLLTTSGSMLVSVAQPGHEENVTIAGSPIKFSRTQRRAFTRAPMLDEHAAEVFDE